MHKAILYRSTRPNMRVTKHNNVDQTFWIFYFLCVFRFLTQKQVKIDQNIKTFKANNKQTKISRHARMITICTQPIKSQNIGSINAWTCYNLMHAYPSSPTRRVRLG